jgi:DNA-binding response OmpR family regulator
MRIALLEDDRDQAEVLKIWLEDAGHTISLFLKSAEFLRVLKHDSFDLMVFDWLLPEMTGLEVLRRIRAESQAGVPVMFVTQQDRECDIVEALGSGADDYMIKPVGRAELLARVNALGRRGAHITVDEFARLEAPPYSVDLGAKEISIHGRVVTLTRKEFELARFLFQNQGRIVSRAHILESVWGAGPAISTRTVDTHASRIRTKLKLPEHDWSLSAVYQHGYRLEFHR